MLYFHKQTKHAYMTKLEIIGVYTIGLLIFFMLLLLFTYLSTLLYDKYFKNITLGENKYSEMLFGFLIVIVFNLYFNCFNSSLPLLFLIISLLIGISISSKFHDILLYYNIGYIASYLIVPYVFLFGMKDFIPILESNLLLICLYIFSFVVFIKTSTLALYVCDKNIFNKKRSTIIAIITSLLLVAINIAIFAFFKSSTPYLYILITCIYLQIIQRACRNKMLLVYGKLDTLGIFSVRRLFNWSYLIISVLYCILVKSNIIYGY